MQCQNIDWRWKTSNLINPQPQAGSACLAIENANQCNGNAVSEMLAIWLTVSQASTSPRNRQHLPRFYQMQAAVGTKRRRCLLCCGSIYNCGRPDHHTASSRLSTADSGYNKLIYTSAHCGVGGDIRRCTAYYDQRLSTSITASVFLN